MARALRIELLLDLVYDWLLLGAELASVCVDVDEEGLSPSRSESISGTPVLRTMGSIGIRLTTVATWISG